MGRVMTWQGGKAAGTAHPIEREEELCHKKGEEEEGRRRREREREIPSQKKKIRRRPLEGEETRIKLMHSGAWGREHSKQTKIYTDLIRLYRQDLIHIPDTQT